MQPLFYAALAFAAGIALAAGPAVRLAPLALAAAIVLAAVGGRRGRAVGALLAIALAGGGWYRLQARRAPAPDALARALAAGQLKPREKILIGGYLRDDPQRGRDYTRFDLEAEFLQRQGRPVSVSGGLRVYVTDAAAATALPRAGQAVEFSAHPRPLRHYLDPGVPDFNRRARREGIGGPVSARWRAALWRRLSAAVDALAPPARAPRVNAVLRAMLLGDSSRLDEATRQDFQIDGIYHVLVVAGLHIGILALFFVWGLRRLGLAPLPARAVCLLLLAAYAWTIAGRTPTLRVLLMLAVYLGAAAWYRQRQALNAVGAAGLILLILRPAALFDPGFQMSFGAALLLAGIAAPHFARGPRLLRRAARQLDDVEYDRAFPPRWAQCRLELRAWRRTLAAIWRPLGWLVAGGVRAGAGLYEVVCVALILQWGLAAFLTAYFHRATPWAALVNAVVVPAVGLLLPLAWAVAGWQMLTGFVPGAGAAAVRALGGAILGFAHRAAAWPLAAARVPTPPAWALMLFAAAVACWLFAARRGGRPLLAATLAVALLALALDWAPFPPRLAAGALTITTLDVGQGDSIFVAFPHGRTLLVDAGPRSSSGFDAGESVVAPFLWSLGLRRLDAVLLTHAHSDHMGGMPFILRA